MALDEKEATAFDGSPMPMQALPVPQVQLEKLTKSITKLENKHLTAKGLIYGDAGTMKTTAAMRILQKITPSDKKILYIDTAEGWSVLMNYPELKERVIHVPFERIEQLWLVADAILNQTPPYNSIGGILFDEYTQMHDEDLNWIVQTRSDQKAKNGEFKDPYQPALPDYNAARIRSNRTLAKFMKLPNTHSLFIGHEREGARKTIVPDMPDKAGRSLYVKLHFVFHTEWSGEGKEAVWRMQTVGGNKIIAKNRVNGVESFSTPERFSEAYLNWGVAKGREELTKAPEPIKNDQESEQDDELLKLLE